MGLFKEAQVKKMLEHVQAGNISFGRMVELMNKDVYKHQEKRGQLVTMMDVVRTLEEFLAHNDHCKNETQIKVKALIDYMKTEATGNVASLLNTLPNTTT